VPAVSNSITEFRQYVFIIGSCRSTRTRGGLLE